jgi:hypothetical protein
METFGDLRYNYRNNIKRLACQLLVCFTVLLFICITWIINNTKLLTFIQYQDDEVVVAIGDGQVLGGSIPIAKMKFLQAWIELHRDELIADWQLAVNGESVYKIDPLR